MTNTPIATMDPSDYVYSDKILTISKWKNNNNVTAKMRLLTHEKKTGRPNGRHQDSTKCQASVFLRIELPPGETIELPSEYDQAIRTVSTRTGEVIGGLCPWLTKIGEENVTIHSSLDYKSAFQHEEALTLVAAMKKEEELNAALAELAKRKAVLTAKSVEVPVVSTKK